MDYESIDTTGFLNRRFKLVLARTFLHDNVNTDLLSTFSPDEMETV